MPLIIVDWIVRSIYNLNRANEMVGGETRRKLSVLPKSFKTITWIFVIAWTLVILLAIYFITISVIR